MTRLSSSVQALLDLWPELPHRLGAEWPALYWRGLDLLRRYAAPRLPWRSPVCWLPSPAVVRRCAGPGRPHDRPTLTTPLTWPTAHTPIPMPVWCGGSRTINR